LHAVWSRRNWRGLLSAELIFLVATAVVLCIRLDHPNISFQEKPMDMGIFASLLRADGFPPPDMWLAGEALPYYYWGALLWTVPISFSGLALDLAYNLVVGLAGVPWFAEGSSGYPAATFGYLLGFIAAAALVGWLSERGDDRRYVPAVGEMVIGSAVIYAFGVTVLMANLNLNLATGLSEGMVPFVIGDGLKLLAAAGLLPLAWKLVNRDKKV